MADTNRRIPLWLIALVGGVAVFSILAVFILRIIFWIRFIIINAKISKKKKC